MSKEPIKRGISFSDIRACYTQEKKQNDRKNVWGYLVFRQISFYPTWLFLKLGVSANQVTVLSLLFGLAGCVLLSLGNHTGIIIGAIMANGWALLDYVDGNIARYRKTSGNYGLYLETWVWAIFGPLLFLSAGAAAYRFPDAVILKITQWFSIEVSSGLFLYLGGWAAVFYILHEFIYIAFVRIFSKDQNTVVEEFKDTLSNSLAYKVEVNFNNIGGLVMPALILASIFQLMGTFILIWAVFTTVAFIAVTINILRRIKSGRV